MAIKTSNSQYNAPLQKSAKVPEVVLIEPVLERLPADEVNTGPALAVLGDVMHLLHVPDIFAPGIMVI